MQNKKLLTALLIIILATVAVFTFGYLNSQQTNQTINQNPNTPGVVNQQQEPGVDQPQGAKPSSQSNLTLDEKAALGASSLGSTVDATGQVALATKVAKETGSINITSCQLDPVVLKVKNQTNFTLKNNGSEEAAVVFYADNVTHLVPALGEVSVKADFGKEDPGLFGYYCRTGSSVYQGLVLTYKP